MHFRSVALSGLLLVAACNSAAPSEAPTTTAPVAATPVATAATPTPAASSPSIDFASLDTCAFLGEGAVRELTGTSLEFHASGSNDPSGSKCFWGATTPGDPQYVEVSFFRRANLTGYNFAPGTDCTSSAIPDPDVEAIGGTCSDPQNKVFVIVAASGVAMSVLVNEPLAPLAPAALLATARSTFDELMAP